MSDALKKRLLEAQNATTFGGYVARMAAGGELGAATRAVFARLDALEAVAAAAKVVADASNAPGQRTWLNDEFAGKCDALVATLERAR